MGNLQSACSGLFHDTVDRSTVCALASFPTPLIDAFHDLVSSEVVKTRSAHLAEVRPALRFGEQNIGTFFADFLEDPDNALEIPDVEGRKNQPHMTEVTVAIFEVMSASCASVSLVRNTHTLVERSIGDNRSSLVKVKKLSVGNLNHCLADNVIVGSVGTILG